MSDDRKDNPYSLRKIFEQIELDLIKSLKRNLARHKKDEEKEGFEWEQWQKAKLRNLINFKKENKHIIDTNGKETDRLVNDDIENNFIRGQKRVDNQLEIEYPQNIANKKLEDEPNENNFFDINNKKIDSLKKVVNNDLTNAKNAALRYVDDIYRQTIYKAEIHMATGAKTLDQAIDLAVKDFLEKGIDCIQYKDGKRVNIASYAEMALRTASHRATLLGEGKKRSEWGIHTIVVSSHANTCIKCAKWQGKVLIDDVFSNGTKEEAEKLDYSLLSKAIEEGFLHPNCRHTLITFIHGVTRLPEWQDTEEAVKKYNAEQEQRAIERDIKKWKRKKEGFQSKENIDIVCRKLSELEIKMEQQLAEHPYLRREHWREKVRGIPDKEILNQRLDVYSGSYLNKIGVTNVSIKDMDIDVPDKVKKNILRECNEVAFKGKQDNIEYATIIDSRTGEPIGKFKLIKGEANRIMLTDEASEYLKTAESGSISVIHNHTNGTSYSSDDVSLFTKYKSIKHFYLTSDEHIYFLDKLSDKGYDYIKIKESIDEVLWGLFKNEVAIDKDNLHGLKVKLFKTNLIDLRRW